MDKSLFTFNKFFYDLVKDVKRVSQPLKGELKKRYKIIDCQCSENMACFDEQMNEPLFQKVVNLPETELFADADMLKFSIFKQITIEKMQAELDFGAPFKWYVYVLTLFHYMHKPDMSDKLYLIVMECIRKIQAKERYIEESKEILDDDIKMLLEKLEAVYSAVEEPSESGLKFDPKMLENSTIGSLAKEIASELDLSNLKVERPEDLLNMGGDNNMIGSIVGKIGSKVNAKLESGELKHEDLLGEAMGLLKSLGGSGALGGFLNNPMFKEMMSGKAKINEEKLRHSSARDRLKKKLEKRHP